MILDENDVLTLSVVRRLLRSGIQTLTKTQQEIIHCLYIRKLKAPKRHFYNTRQMSGQDVDNQLAEALRTLRIFFEQSGISGFYDIL